MGSTKNTGGRSSASGGGTAKKTVAKTDKKLSGSRKVGMSDGRRKVWSVVLAAAGLLLLALCAVPGANAWAKLSGFLFDIFGISCWFICVMLLYTAILLALDAKTRHIYTKLIEIGIIAAFVCAFVYTVTADGAGHSYGEAIKAALALDKKWGYGFFGALIGWPLLQLGKVPAIIVEVIVAVAAFAIMSGKGLINLIELIKKWNEKRRAARLAREAEEAEELANGNFGKRGKQESSVYIDGHEVPPEAQAKNQLNKKPENSGKKKVNVDIPYEPADNEVIPVQADSPRPEPSKEQLADLESIISNLNAPYKRAERFEGEQQPLPGVDPPPSVAGEITPEIEQIADKATAEAAAKDAAAADSATYKPVKTQNYKSPPMDLLAAPRYRDTAQLQDELRATAANLVDALRSFNVEARVINICCGPSVTRYELQPSAGVKISKITNLSNDIAMALAAQSVRIEAPIPGKAAIGIEIPNKTVATVNVREVLESDKFWSEKSNLSVALGKDISGNVVIADLAKMPHLLIAGTTGSGKSVCINSFLMSLIYKSKPEDVRLLLIDPKVVELNIYNGIPHLLIPVVTNAKKAAGALSWAVSEMMDRYKLFADHNVRDLAGFNEYARGRDDLSPLPQVVIFIDELSDLMMVARNEVEDSICRLAQMARAAGMHLVIATQRPSTDVITGIIKANIPSRIAFAVSSQIDSRVVLDAAGAEKLLGRGDMLFCPIGVQKPHRIQGCYIGENEVERVIDFLKNKFDANYDPEIETRIEQAVQRSAAAESSASASEGGAAGGEDGGEDDMLIAAIDVVVDAGSASTSLLQRKLRLGYGRAARIIDELEERNIVGAMDGSKPRTVLLSREQWLEMKMRSEIK